MKIKIVLKKLGVAAITICGLFPLNPPFFIAPMSATKNPEERNNQEEYGKSEDEAVK